MKSTIELLDLAKHAQGDISDYRIAQILGVSQPTVSAYRIGRAYPSNPIAARLAELAGLDPEAAICWVNIERARDETEAKTWLRVLSRVERTKPARLAS